MPVRRSSNHIPSSPAAEVEAPIKQGIGTILGADREGGTIRRTLSADMSSKKWLQQNGFFSPMKKIDYSQEMSMAMAAADHSSGSSSSSSSEGEEETEENQDQDDVWRSIQLEKESKKADQSGVWGSLLNQKSDNSLLLPPPPPYVSAPAKRSASSMTEKSLEVCTESLGSETGSDCFSCFGETEGLKDGDEEMEEKQRNEEDPSVDLHVVKYRNSPVRPFPPPLPSLSGGDGESLRMHSHRQNGRLILEAVSVASRNCFHAQRHDGRLVLTLMHGGAEEEQFETAGHAGDDVYEVEEERESGGEKKNLSLPSGMISVPKSGLVMKKLMGVKNINPKCSNKFNEEEELPIPHSLPPRPPVARPVGPPPAAASFNAYEYFWRSKPTIINKNINQDLLQSKTEHLLPCMKSRCKEARRSLIWKPYCIATS